MPFIADSDLQTSLANALKISTSSLPATWNGIITESNNSAYADILGALAGRGFTPAQVAGWDRGVEFNKDIGLFWCLVKGAGLHGNDATFIDKLDRRKELLTIYILISGAIAVPGSTTPAVVGSGTFDTSTDNYTRLTTW